jgi:hypothetical protein
MEMIWGLYGEHWNMIIFSASGKSNSQARLAKRDVRSVHVAKMILKDWGWHDASEILDPLEAELSQIEPSGWVVSASCPFGRATWGLAA